MKHLSLSVLASMASWPEPTASSIFCPQEVVLGSDPWPYGKKPVFVLSTRALPPVAPEAVVEHRGAS